MANISVRIILYELLRLSKLTRETLREALTDVEAFMARIPAELEEEDVENCLNTSQHAPYRTFTPYDMQVNGNYGRPMYFTRYTGSSKVSRI